MFETDKGRASHNYNESNENNKSSEKTNQQARETEITNV